MKTIRFSVVLAVLLALAAPVLATQVVNIYGTDKVDDARLVRAQYRSNPPGVDQGNFGTLNQFSATALYDDVMTTVIKFDTSEITPGTTVLGVEFKLFCIYMQAFGGGGGVVIDRVTRDWDEATVTSEVASMSPFTPWTRQEEPFSDHDFNLLGYWLAPNPTVSEAKGAMSFSSSDPTYGAALLAAVQDMVDNPGTNFGFALYPEFYGYPPSWYYNSYTFKASEWGGGIDSGQPLLEITIPEPATIGLLALSSLAILRRKRNNRS